MKNKKKINETTTKNIWIVYLAGLCIAVAIIYSNTLNAPFIYDDGITIVENAEIKSNTIFAEIGVPRYVGLISFALNYQIHQLNPAGYHVTNIIIHLCNGILVFFLMRNIILLLHGSLIEKERNLLSFSIALLFVVHPLQTQAVTYITQRFASLAAFFVLISLLSYSAFRKSDSPRYSLYILSLLSAFLAFKTKENTASLPLMLVVIEYMLFKKTAVPMKRRILYLIPFFLLILVIPLSFMSLQAIHDHNVAGILKEIKETSYESPVISRNQYLITEFRVVATYIRLMLLPVNQSIDYYYPLSKSFFEPGTFLSFCLILVILIISIILFKKFPLISFGIYWFFIFLLIESSLIPIADVIYEHRMYLPSIGFIIAFVISLHILCQRLALTKYTGVLILIIALIVSVLTYKRNEVWKSEMTLWKDASTKFPLNPRARLNLGAAYSSAGMCDEAIKELEIGLEKEPGNPKARSEIAYCYWKKGLAGIAIKEMLLAIQLEPTNVSYYINTALIYLEQSKITEALSVLHKGHTVDASNAPINALLGKTYCLSGDFTSAMLFFDTSLKINHEDAYTHYDKAQCLLTYGRTEESRTSLFAALKNNPQLIDAYFYIALSYEQEKNSKQASYFYNQFLSKALLSNPLTTEAKARIK